MCITIFGSNGKKIVNAMNTCVKMVQCCFVFEHGDEQYRFKKVDKKKRHPYHPMYPLLFNYRWISSKLRTIIKTKSLIF